MSVAFYKEFNCYEILGIPPDASVQEVKAAFREACRRNHPDLGGTHEAMVRVNAAWEVLSDPVSRIEHDQYWSAREASWTKPRPRHEPRPQKPSPSARPGPQPGQPDGRIAAEPLMTLRNRIIQGIEARAEAIRAGLATRTERLVAQYKAAVRDARHGLAYSLAGGALSALVGATTRFKIAFLGVPAAGFAFVVAVRGPVIAGKHRSPLNPMTSWMSVEAERAASRECGAEVANLRRYNDELAEILGLVLRTSTYDDSESQVARRITTAFFVLGYSPVAYNAQDRTLVFTDGEEEAVVRFRHRTGPALNVTYVQKLVQEMRARRSSRGYLFCSPGLSGNAATFATANNIHAYSIETMTQWIDAALAADYGGPPGDILKNLDELKTFLGTLSNVLPGRSSGSSSGRRWRRSRRRYW